MPADALAADCAVDGCLRPVGGRGALCAMHYKRAQRGQELNAPVQEKLTQFERVVQAGIDLADVESEDDGAWDKARERFRKAVENWSRSLLATKGGKAKAATLSKAARRAHARMMAGKRWNACQQASGGAKGGQGGGQEGVQPARHTPARGCQQREDSKETPTGSRKALPEGQVGKSARHAGVGEGDARLGGAARAAGDRAPRRADESAKEAQRGASGSAGVARPGGTEAVQPGRRQTRTGAAR